MRKARRWSAPFPPSALLRRDHRLRAGERGKPLRDEHGFLGPEEAAVHAIVVQGGYSTPPVEAYRMIRDGGAGRERALAWLERHGLDPADPREGRGVPWPLPERESDQ